MQIGCRFSSRFLDREFIVPLRKRNERLEFYYPVFPMASKKANEVYGATRFNSAAQSSCTIYLQLFYTISHIATLHDL